MVEPVTAPSSAIASSSSHSFEAGSQLSTKDSTALAAGEPTPSSSLRCASQNFARQLRQRSGASLFETPST